MASDTCYTIIHQDDSTDQPSLQELKSALEKGSEEVKIETMKKILVTMLNGDKLPQLLMQVIRFVMPSKNINLNIVTKYIAATHYGMICNIQTSTSEVLLFDFYVNCGSPSYWNLYYLRVGPVW